MPGWADGDAWLAERLDTLLSIAKGRETDEGAGEHEEGGDEAVDEVHTKNILSKREEEDEEHR